MKSFKEYTESVDALEYLLSLTPEKVAEVDKRHAEELKKSQKPVLDAIDKIDKHIKDIVAKHNALKSKDYKQNNTKLSVGDFGSFNDHGKTLTISDINNRKKIKALRAYKDEYMYASKVKSALQKDIDSHIMIDYNPVVTITKEGFLRISGFSKRTASYIEHDKLKISKMPG